MRTPILALLAVIPACCSDRHAPTLGAPASAVTGVGEIWEVPLADLVLSSRDPLGELEFIVTGSGNVEVGISGDDLFAIPAQGFVGREPISLTVTDRCASATLVFDLIVGSVASECGTVFRSDSDASELSIAGDFNDWSPEPMASVDGGWELSVDLAPGSYAYKFVENGSAWTCDPAADAFQCDDGYDRGAWDDCSPGASSCNSVVTVADCGLPTLGLTALTIDAQAGTANFSLTYGGSPLGAAEVVLDGTSQGALDWDGTGTEAVSLTGLTSGRHTVRVEASDVDGFAAEPLYLPFWTDGRSWETGLLYYAFVDRFHNGDAGNDQAFNSTHPWTDYVGGDWQGVIDKLDYLDDLGVTAIWLTAPQDNPAGIWGSKCGATFTGYHGYWPADPWRPEEHFGDEAKLRELIDAAHDRGMRVLVDWVANHVHTDHAYYADHPEWFNDQALCVDANNWNDIPETCWFDPFLPDIDYYQVEPAMQMVDDAMVFAREYDLDGYRVDAVKHMPYSVYATLQGRIRGEIEHREAGGVDDFYTVGETFDTDRGLIASYVSERELDAQFDFPLYFTVRAALIDQTVSLEDLESSRADGAAAFSGFTMSTFLGNHDVPRFLTVANEGDQGSCAAADSIHPPAGSPDWDLPYEKLKLGWTFLLAGEGLPLVYYGDEIGLPGHNDPDNRQAMRFGADLSAREADVLQHVQRLGQARRAYPQLAVGDREVWWSEADVLAWSRVHEGQGMIAVINRSDSDRTLSNSLAWAGLPTDGSWLNVLTGEALSASGDSIDIDVPARGSAVLVTVTP